MKNLKYVAGFVLAILLTGCSLLQPNTHPILGSWSYYMDGCEEVYTFKVDGIRIANSRDEIVKAKYEIKTISEIDGVYWLRDEVIEDNGLPDCSTSTRNMTGDVVEVFVKIESNPNRFKFCFDESLKRCVGPFIKKDASTIKK